MNRFPAFWRICIPLWLGWMGACLGASTNGSLPQLREKLSETLSSSAASQGWWGASVVCLDNGLPIFATNENRHFTPASTTKLFTVALALNRLGGDFRIKTSVMSSAAPDASGAVHGDLAIVGRGDPTITPRFHTGNGSDTDTSLIASIKRAGIKSVHGKLIIDGSWLKSAPYGSGWEWDDLVEGYAAPVSALTINDNACRLMVTAGQHVSEPAKVSWQPINPLLTVDNQVVTRSVDRHATSIEYHRIPGTSRLLLQGSIVSNNLPWFADISCAEPIPLFAGMLRAELEKNGITISQTNHLVGSFEESPLNYGEWKEIAYVQSPPLSDIAALTLKPSQNLYAQLLLLQVGDQSLKRQRAGDISPQLDQEAAGIRELNQWLASIGVPSGDISLEEGSGLSRRNTITPRGVSYLLRHMATNRWHESWIKSLPVGGVDGTLQSRFTESPARGRVHAKTGSLRGVQALAGYVTTAGGQTVVFAIYASQFTPSEVTAARKTIDRFVEHLAAFSGRIEEAAGPAKN